MKKLLTIIDGPRLTSCTFEKRQVADKKKGPVTVPVFIRSAVVIKENNKEAIIRYHVESDAPAVPFKFSIEMKALYNIVKKASAKEINEAGKTEANSSIFVIVRDFIAELTNKAGLRPFWMNYGELRKAEEKRVKNRITSKKKTKSAE